MPRVTLGFTIGKSISPNPGEPLRPGGGQEHKIGLDYASEMKNGILSSSKSFS